MSADPIIYCLEHVTDYNQFERLCNDLMAAEGYTAIEPLGGMRDKGRDAIHVDQHNPDDVTIFAYSVREDWGKKLDEDCRKIQQHGHTCKHVAFLCTETFTSAERDEAVAFVQNKFGWTLNLYGLERLRLLLRTVHVHVVANHPQIFPPPFFPQAGGLTVVDARDCLVLDYPDEDETLAAWLARRLILEGYRVWCRSIAPIGGSSLDETIKTLIKHRAFRLLSFISPSSVLNPDLAARRVLASEFLIPIVTAPVDVTKLETKTRSLEPIQFDRTWATGLGQLLKVLDAAQCSRAQSGEGIALRSFVPPDFILSEPEVLYSNRFQVLALPEALKRFTSRRPLEGYDVLDAARKWAFRGVDQQTFIAFHAPPGPLCETLRIETAGGVTWRHISQVEGIPTRDLVAELIRKSLEIRCVQSGLKYCYDSHLHYFPEGLLKFDRLYFTKPNRTKTFINAVGSRKYWRPSASAVYKYQIAPRFSVVRMTETSFAVLLRILTRLTDEKGEVLQTRTAVSRRKHLRKNWWNDDWFHRILATMQFLGTEDRVTIGDAPDNVISIALTPDHWTVQRRINEAALKGAEEAREDAMSHLEKEDEESDDQ